MALLLSSQEIASFEGGRHRKITVMGPVKLCRLVGRNASGEASNKYGRFWFNEKLFWNVLDEITNHQHDEKFMNFLIKRLLRELTAVCYDWNSFAGVYFLEVPVGKTLDVAVGPIKSQPYYSPTDPKKRVDPLGRELLGGDFQYIVNVTPAVQDWVAGPQLMNLRIGHA